MIRERAFGAAALALAWLLVTAAGAQGATVSIYESCLSAHGCDPLLTYDAAPGEANDVTTIPDSRGIVVRDTGAPLSAGDGCKQDGDHQAVCGSAALALFDTGDGNDRVAGPFPGTGGANVDLGPGDDVLDGPGVETAAGGPGNDVMLHGVDVFDWSGGEGNDRISASGFSAYLDGGPGNDDVEGGDDRETINGGPGEDTVRGLGGDDFLIGDDRLDNKTPAVVAADSIDGGEGIDFVRYSARTEPVSVDLSHGGPSGAAGEGDQLTSVEGASGGVGDDVLIGDDGANLLLGGPGADVLTGGPGRDVLEGGAGLDRISAGQGNDLIAASTSSRFAETPAPFGWGADSDSDEIDCGPGLDVLEAADLDVPTGDCETAVFAAGYRQGRFALMPMSAGPRAATFDVRCPSTLRVKGRCAGRLTLLADGERRQRSFSLPKAGGPVTVARPPGTRVLLTLRYRAHPGVEKPYTYGVSVYLDLPPWDDSAPPIAMG